MTFLNMLPGILVAYSFYGFYRNLFVESPGIRLPGIAFFFSLSSVGLAIVLEMLLSSWIAQETIFIQAFLLSSLPEEIAKFLFVYLYFKINRIEYSMSEGIFYGILFGLFFGLVENLFYSFGLGLWPMLVRSTTALPLHMITGGIFGAFVLVYENSNRENYPIIELFRGFLICYLIHAFYNFGVFHSGNMLYLLPITLVIGFFILEYEIMTSRNTLPKEVMEIIGIKWDDYKIIHRFKQYLDWMDVDQEKYIHHDVSILQKPKQALAITAAVFLVLGLTTLCYLLFFPEMITQTFAGIQFPEYISIFVFYPLFVALVLGFSGTLNPEYFRNKIIRIPIFISLHIRSDDYEETTVVFYISRKGFYVPILDPAKIGDSVTMDFWIAGRELANIQGKVYWRDMGGPGENGGVLVRFEGIPIQLIFLWNLVLYRQRIKNLLLGSR